MTRTADSSDVLIPDPDGFTDREVQVAAMLASGRNQTQIQREIGIDTKTIRRMLRDRSFRGLVRSTRRATAFIALGSMADGLNDAVAALRLEIENGERAADRIRAADILITQFMRLNEVIEVDDRLSALEEKAFGESESAVPKTSAVWPAMKPHHYANLRN